MSLGRALLPLIVATLAMLTCALGQTNPGFIDSSHLCANYPNSNCSNDTSPNPFSLNQAFTNKMDYPGTTSNVADFAGATAGDKIAACVAALPSVGGVCDARSLPSGGMIPAITLGKSGVTVLGPCGLFTVTGTITVTSATPATSINGFQWIGCNSPFNLNTAGTVLTWGGNAIDPMFRLQGVIYSGLEGFKVIASLGTPLLSVIQFETKTGANSGSRTLRNIVMEGTNGGITDEIKWCTGNTGPYACGPSAVTNNTTASGNAVLHFASVPSYVVPGMYVSDNAASASITNGTQVLSVGVGTVTMTANAAGSGVGNGDTIVFSTGAGPDANNDIDYLENIVCFNYGQSCQHMLGTQVQGIHYYHNTRVGLGLALPAYGVFDEGGSFFSEADGGGANGIADFYVARTPGTITISNYNGESSTRFLQVGAGASAFSIPVNIIGGRWAADELHADNNVIIQYGIGPLNIIGFEVDGTGGASAPQFMIWPNTAPVSATAIGVKIAAPNATITTNPFVAGAGNPYGQWTNIGAQLTGGTPVNIHVPDNFYADNVSKPVISSCGSSVPAVATYSKNSSGQFTAGSGGGLTACTATFFTAFPNAAFCTVTPVSDLGVGVRYWLTQSASAFIVNSSADISSKVFNYSCGGG